MAEAQWYYLEDGEQKGPVTEKQLLGLFLNKILSPSSKVWSPTATQGWEPIGNIAKFRKQLDLSSRLGGEEVKQGPRRAFAPTAGSMGQSNLGIWADKDNLGSITTQKRGFSIVGWIFPIFLVICFGLAMIFRPQLEQKFPKQFSQIYLQSGNARCLSGDNEGALNDFKQAVILDPTLAEAYFHKGATEIKMGNTRDAWPDFQQCLKINPKYVPGLYGAAYLEADTGNYKSALKDLNDALVIDPKCADAYYGRGLMREKMGSRSGAIVDLQTAADMFAKNGKMGKADRCKNTIDLLKKADTALDQPPPTLKWQEKGDCLAHDLVL